MSVLEKLQRRARILDRRGSQSLSRYSYDSSAADQRELLEEAIQEISLLQTNLDLHRSCASLPRQMGG